MIKLIQLEYFLLTKANVLKTNFGFNRCLSTGLMIKVDGEKINIADIPTRPKKLNLFEKYCQEQLGHSNSISEDEKKRLSSLWEKDEKSFLEKNQTLLKKYQQDLDNFKNFSSKTTTLKEVLPLIEFYLKEVNKKQKKKKLSFYNFFIKENFQPNLTMKDLSVKFKNLTESEKKRFDNLYKDYCQQNEDNNLNKV